MNRSHLLLAAACLCALDIGSADAQMSQPPLVGDGASIGVAGGTASILGTVTAAQHVNANLTVQSGNTATFASTTAFTGAVNENWSKATGSTAQTITITGGGLILEGTIASVVDNTSETLGRRECVENFQASTAATVTSGSGSFVLSGGSTSVGSYTLTAGAGKCFMSDGTNHYEIGS